MTILRVLVIGIRAEHAQALKGMYKDQISFTFITDGDRHVGKSRGEFDYVYSLYKFTNHSV